MSMSSEYISTKTNAGKLQLPLEEIAKTSQPTRREANVSISLAARIARGKSERFVEISLVSPEMADAMLKRNVGNRPLVRSRVAKHVLRLREGTFRLLHQGIAFSKDGRLIDGQHRLTAVMEAGIAAPFTVTFGAEREEFNCVDQGGVRTAADLLAIDGKHHAALRSAVAAVLMVLDRAPLLGAQEVAQYARDLDTRGDLFSRAVILGHRMHKVTNPTSAAVAYYVIGKAGAATGLQDAFWEGMATGENLSGSRLRLREWLTHNEIAERNGRDLTVKRAAVIISAWNSWRRHRKTVDFAWEHTTSLPAVRP